MASYLRPRRGKKSTAVSQAVVLKRGEVFFEVPSNGVGTGKGNIKMGDGSTSYSALPYFLVDHSDDNAVIDFTDTSTATDSTNNSTYLTNIAPANSLKTIFTNLKQLLYNYNSQLTSLNNDIDAVVGTGVSHNGFFRGKNLGTISSISDYRAFRTAHGIDDHTYKDLYLGDYVTISGSSYTGTDCEWMVAHFDYGYNGGSSAVSPRGVMWIPRTTAGSGKMNSSDTTSSGYTGSAMHTSVLPTIKTNLEKVLKDSSNNYLVTRNLLLSTAGAAAGATNWAWTNTQIVLPNEVQIYGCNVWGNGSYNTGEACEKLAVFNFINHVEYSRSHFWLRSVVSASYFALAGHSGRADRYGASNSNGLRPLILTN